MSIEALIAVLEASVRKRGEIALTNSHLLNILKMSQRWEDKRRAQIDMELNEILAEDKKWGS